MSAPKSNTNAAKGPELRLSLLHMRVPTSSKAAWVKSAQAEGTTLSDWAIKRLDSAANNL